MERRDLVEHGFELAALGARELLADEVGEVRDNGVDRGRLPRGVAGVDEPGADFRIGKAEHPAHPLLHQGFLFGRHDAARLRDGDHQHRRGVARILEGAQGREALLLERLLAALSIPPLAKQLVDLLQAAAAGKPQEQPAHDPAQDNGEDWHGRLELIVVDAR